MSLDSQLRQEMVRLELERAKSNLFEAEQCASMELWNVVGNRMYYAVFHAVAGLLIDNGIEVGGHRGAAVMFGKHFVLSGMFSSDEGKLYRQLQTIRERADYDNVYNLEPSKGMEYLEKAKGLILKIECLIK